MLKNDELRFELKEFFNYEENSSGERKGKMPQTLDSVKESIDRFLFEAAECAAKELGFAAMLATFSVVLAVSEAVIGSRRNVDLMKWFLSNMDDDKSWLKLPQTMAFSIEQVGQKLAGLRDSLAHQFSMPADVSLANNEEDAKLKVTENPDRYIICTNEFVRCVKRSVEKMIIPYPNAVLDPHPSAAIGREAAIRIDTTTPALSGAPGKRVP